MKILALIAARGGSKRILGKNIRELAGKPLVVWSIDAMKNVPDICDVMVSTDSVGIAEVSRRAGALVPWLRPPELASDEAKSIDVCIHALDWYESVVTKVDALMLLQPTSPFRSYDTICRGIQFFKSNPSKTVIAVSPAQSHPAWCFKIKDCVMYPYLNSQDMPTRSQDLDAAYVVNGSLYISSPDNLRQNQTFFSRDVAPLVVEEPEEAHDIDTEWDWKIAELIATEREKSSFQV